MRVREWSLYKHMGYRLLIFLSAGVAVIWGPRVLGTLHPHTASELGMGVPIMPGGLGIPVGPKALGIWGPHSE